MKLITNERIGRASYYIYRMRRVIGEQQIGLDVSITRYEREHHRQVVAMRLKDARQLLHQGAQGA